MSICSFVPQAAEPSQQDEILRLVREQVDQLRRLSERIYKVKVI